MPRQLPWLNSGSGSRTQTKKPSKAINAVNAPTDIDDDFFDGTVLAASSRGKGKAVQGEDSDEDFPVSRGAGSGRVVSRKTRAPSSSPPPIVDDAPPDVEEMRKGVSRFELRDDEWMMVEDEFLETAKLFTRHMRLAEYETLKEQIEAKKKEQVQAPRPVVAGGKLSAEGSMKKKAEVQEKRQRQAIQDVFASQGDYEEEDMLGTSFLRPRPAPTLLKQPPRPAAKAADSDSDDLDAPKPSSRRPPSRHIPPKAISASSLSSIPPTIGQNSALPPAPTPTFTKPALPAPKHPVGTARRSRFNIDMFDDYTPPTNAASPQAPAPGSATRFSSKPATSVARPSSPVKVKTETKASDEWGSGLSKETAARIAKRKAEKDKEQQIKKKSAKIDDIPTFLV